MYTDFPEKYEELREYMRLKHAKELTNRQRGIIKIISLIIYFECNKELLVSL
jgi:hypothetical protein